MQSASQQQSLKLAYTVILYIELIDIWNIKFKYSVHERIVYPLPIGTKLIKTKRSRYKSKVKSHDIGTSYFYVSEVGSLKLLIIANYKKCFVIRFSTVCGPKLKNTKL